MVVSAALETGHFSEVRIIASGSLAVIMLKYSKTCVLYIKHNVLLQYIFPTEMLLLISRREWHVSPAAFHTVIFLGFLLPIEYFM